MKNIHRSFQRALALVLAFAMVLTMSSVSQTMDVSAASAKYVKSIKTSKKSVTVNVGKSVKVNATVKVAGKTSQKVTVKTSNKKVATVKAGKPNKKGVSTIKITGKKAGKATITVTTSAKGKKGKKLYAKIKVNVKKADEQQEEPQPQPAPAMTNGSVQLPITNGQSSDPSIATVDATGKVTAGTKAGTVTITGKDASGKDVVYTVTVTDADVAASHKVTINVAKTELVVGESIVATATVVPASDSVTWTSSDNSIATVDKDGQIVAVAAGSTRITATTASGATNSVTITVKAIAVTGIEVVGSDSIDLVTSSNASTTLNVKVLPENATDRRVTFTTSKEGIVTVNNLGVVEAKAAGDVEVYATTTDGGYKATWKIHVADKTNEDIDTLKMSVTNAIEGHENTVLTGTRMAIGIEVSKNGQSQGGDNNTVTLELEPIAGYTSYYELVEDVVKLDASGKGTAFIKFNKNNQKTDNGYTYDALIEDSDYYEDAAYASYKLVATAGGASLTSDINVTFAQVLVETENSKEGTALTVNNGKEIGTAPIERTTGVIDTEITTNNDGYKEEYVVSQQVTSSSTNHAIELDASPLLIIPATENSTNKGVYDKKYNYTSEKFSIYSSFDKAYTIEDVPGGLNYLTLTFDNLSLSAYTKLVVRCYEKDTNNAYKTANGYMEHIIQYTTDLAKGQTVTFGDEVFKYLDDTEYIDIKVFVESAGQVNNNQRGGYTLVSGYGKFANKTYNDYSIVKLSECVTWEIQPASMSAAQTLSNPSWYLGSDNYNSAYTYSYSLPTGEMTGNAIIYVKDSNGEEKEPFMYPVKQENHKNVLDDHGSYYIMSGITTEEITGLNKGDFTYSVAEDGDLIIDSLKSGFVNVKATVNIFNIATYELFSSVQWCPVPTKKNKTASEFYAVAGETVTLKAVVHDENGNPKGGASVNWTIDGISVEDIKANPNYTADVAISDTNAYTTNDKATATLEIRGKKHLDVSNIVAELGGNKTETKDYDIQWYVDDKLIQKDYANIHWVKPGMYYDNSALVDGDEYYTNLAVNNVEVAQNTYLAAEEWLLGIKVVGTEMIDNPAYDPDNISEDVPEKLLVASKNVTISNIKVGLQNQNAGTDVTVTPQANEPGAFLLKNSKKGISTETFSMDGYTDITKRCIITINGVPHTSVGKLINEGAFITGAKLIIPVKWTPNGQKLTIETPSGAVFNVANSEDPVIYLKVVDNTEAANAVEGAKVTYNVYNESENIVLSGKNISTDANGLIKIVFDADHRPDDTIETQENWVIKASINNGTEVVQNIIFNKADDQLFKLLGDKPVETNGVNKTVKMTFTNSVDAQKLVSGMFELTDNGNKVDIESIKVDAVNAANIVVITTKQEFTDAGFNYSIKPVVVDEQGIIYQLLDKEGRLYTE